jgi:hypothetical protein
VRSRTPPRPFLLTRHGADKQAGIVTADRPRPYQNGIDAGPYIIDPIEVLLVGQHQSGSTRGADVAVDGHRHRQQDVRA